MTLEDIIWRAHQEDRWGYKVTDPWGRPCNGGSGDPIPLPTVSGEPGEWTDELPVSLCASGWHLTRHPHKWTGARVFLCEGQGVAQRGPYKSAWPRIRALAEVTPANVIDPSCAARMANWFRVFEAPGADLRGADLRGANLWLANLGLADLRGANLRGADLRFADLRFADLGGANLGGANLRDADLRDANLRDANLGGWDRGPDGFATRTA